MIVDLDSPRPHGTRRDKAGLETRDRRICARTFAPQPLILDGERPFPGYTSTVIVPCPTERRSGYDRRWRWVGMSV